MIFLLVTGLAVVKSVLGDNDTNLVYNIRRQLMQDNYDYLTTESDEDFPLNPKNEKDHRSAEKVIDDYNYHEHDKLRLNLTDIAPRAQDDVIDDNKDNDGEVSKKDLIYYISDDRIGLKNDIQDYNERDIENQNVTSAKVKYKVMKVKSAHPNRRSLTFRRFLQERGKDGVSIMSLDDEPFPEFRLPKSRRQYMQETSDNEDMVNLAEDFSFEENMSNITN